MFSRKVLPNIIDIVFQLVARDTLTEDIIETQPYQPRAGKNVDRYSLCCLNVAFSPSDLRALRSNFGSTSSAVPITDRAKRQTRTTDTVFCVEVNGGELLSSHHETSISRAAMLATVDKIEKNSG